MNWKKKEIKRQTAEKSNFSVNEFEEFFLKKNEQKFTETYKTVFTAFMTLKKPLKFSTIIKI